MKMAFAVARPRATGSAARRDAAHHRPRREFASGQMSVRVMRPSLTWGDVVVDAGVEHPALQGADHLVDAEGHGVGAGLGLTARTVIRVVTAALRVSTIVWSAEADRLVMRARLGPLFCPIGAHGGVATQPCQVRGPPGPVDIVADNREQPFEIRVSQAARAPFSSCSSAVRYVMRPQGRGLRRLPAEPGTGDVRR